MLALNYPMTACDTTKSGDPESRAGRDQLLGRCLPFRMKRKSVLRAPLFQPLFPLRAPLAYSSKCLRQGRNEGSSLPLLHAPVPRSELSEWKVLCGHQESCTHSPQKAASTMAIPDSQ